MPDFAFQFWNRVDALLDSRKMSCDSGDLRTDFQREIFQL